MMSDGKRSITRKRQFHPGLLLAVIALVVAAGFSPGREFSVRGQSDPSLVWKKPETVERKPKVYQKPRPRPRKPVRVKAPLLTLRWRVIKRDDDLKAVTTNPNAVFQLGDRVQLAIRVNQSGYLYIVRDDLPEQAELPLLFPDSRINDGQNFVKKDQEIILPSNCAAEYNDAKGNCWFMINEEPDEYTVIFSREMLLDLPDKLTKNTGSVKVKQQTINNVTKDSGMKPEVAPVEQYTVQVWNPNPKDNEVLIARIVIRHEKKE